MCAPRYAPLKAAALLGVNGVESLGGGTMRSDRIGQRRLGAAWVAVTLAALLAFHAWAPAAEAQAPSGTPPPPGNCWNGALSKDPLHDSDGATATSWQWQRRTSSGGAWTSIGGATSDSYTATASDVGKQLRATVSYTDSHGPGQTAESSPKTVLPGKPTKPTLGLDTTDDDTLVVNYTAATGLHAQLEMHYSATQNGTYTRDGGAVNATASPVKFGGRQYRRWYKARSRDCLTKERTGCGEWSGYSDAIFLLETLPAPTIAVDSTATGIVVTYRVLVDFYYKVALLSANTVNVSASVTSSGDETLVPTRAGVFKAGITVCQDAARTVACRPYVYSSGSITKLSPPIALDVFPMPGRKAQVRWAGDTNGTGYTVQVRSLGGTWGKPGGSETSVKPSYELDLDRILHAGGGLANDPYAYELRVKSTHNTGKYLDSEYSDEITIIDNPIQSANGDSPNAAPNQGKAVIDWTAVSGAGSITIRWRKLGKDAAGRYHYQPGWKLDHTSLPASFVRSDRVTITSPTQTRETIRDLDLGEIYAIQLNYSKGGARFFSGRDVYAWPSDGKPGSGQSEGKRVAGFPFFGHYEDKTYRYRICADTFFPDDPDKQRDWVALLGAAFTQWQTATNGFIQMTRETGGCTKYSAFPFPNPIVYAIRVSQDDDRSEIRMMDVSPTTTGLSSIGEMMLDPFKLCVLNAVACVTSLSGYGRFDRQAGTILPSADITFNRNRLENVVPRRPDAVRFNTCFQGTTAMPADGKGGHFYAYALAVHEAGHALGLSDWTFRGSVALPMFNELVKSINLLPSRSIPTIPEGPARELVKEYVYLASHPGTPDSAMNYDRMIDSDEPDCSPHPLDIMAIYSLYQSRN